MTGELAAEGIRVPGGLATTAQAFRDFLKANQLDQRIASRLDTLDVDNVMELAKAGTEIRGWMTDAPLQPQLREGIATAYAAMVAQVGGAFSVAVRSSATAEDLPDASFAGQQETFININWLDNILHAVNDVFASLYNDRAIAYRVHTGFVQAEMP
jgi:pyruvate, water dikinase